MLHVNYKKLWHQILEELLRLFVILSSLKNIKKKKESGFKKLLMDVLLLGLCILMLNKL